MFETNSLEPKADNRPSAPLSNNPAAESKQRRLMAIALSLLLVALVSVLYHDRDFWFPDTLEAADDPDRPLRAEASPGAQSTPGKSQLAPRKKSSGKSHLTASAQPADSDPPFVTTTTRTVLPPLEVEVVAGDAHRRVASKPNAVEVELQPDTQTEADNSPAPFANTEASAANVTDNAAERVQMSADTAEMVSEPVKPDYPMLARQMKVQGSVILLAMISREGQIQDLRILSGPPILSSAAREAVKQWHFKPHYQGADAVETAARITVNFTISTN